QWAAVGSLGRPCARSPSAGARRHGDWRRIGEASRGRDLVGRCRAEARRYGRSASVSVTALRAGIGERLARNGNELPVEAGLVQSQLKYAKSVRVADQAVGSDASVEGEMTFPARTRDDLDDASCRGQVSGRLLRREAVVVWGL